MPSDYDKLNEYIRDDLPSQIKGVLAGLYDDRTHFILELLQNAEDVHASRIRFVLHADRLEVLHDGRLFNEDDVCGVCSVGRGTKKDDLTAIGRFGIGFKSVYAVTSTPEIHSGDEHFAITNCVQARGVAPEAPPPPWTTLFRLPFDHDELSKEAAFAEIAAHLQELKLRTLLFLRHVREIDWEVVGSTSGTYLRESDVLYGVADRIWLVGQYKGDDREEQWLVFRRAVEMPELEVHDERDRPRVEVAFRIEEVQNDIRNEDDQTTPPPQYTIVRVDESPLVVFFPTAKMTRLGFLIQGPYRTTPARDNIPQHDESNTDLVKETGELLVKALRVFRREGYLSPELFEILPIQREAFPEGSMFRPLFDRLKEALQTEPFLPGDDGDPISADEAILARGGDSRALLTPTQVTTLLQSEPPLRWLSRKVTEDLHPELRKYLRESLAIREFTHRTLAGALAERPAAAFLEQQSDEWMIRFYAYLLDHKELWKSPPGARSEPRLRNVPILRLEDRRHVAPFKPDGTPAAYLPGSCDLQVPFVRATIAADEQAQEFLKALGLYTPDPVDEVIASVLPKYDQPVSPTNLDETQYALDVRAIHEALRTDLLAKHKRIVDRAKTTCFILAKNAATGERSLRRPTEVYVYSEEIGRYFTANENAWFMVDAPSLATLDAHDLQLLGVAAVPRLIEFDPQFTNSHKAMLRDGNSSTRDETVLDRDIDGLAEALDCIEQHSHPSGARGIAHAIWGVLLKHLETHQGDAFWRGRYEYFYFHKRKSEFDAVFLKRLKTAAWLPDRDGTLAPPCERDVADLPDTFELHDEITERLGITNAREQDRHKITEQERMADQLGVELGEIEFLKSNRKAFNEWRDTLIASQKPPRPVRPVVDEDRRGTKIDEQVRVAPPKDYQPTPRTTRVSAPDAETDAWLRYEYTNEDGQMLCQICADAMPFKKRDGKYYFEAVEFTGNAAKEHRALYLALCPVCAAKYKEFVKRDSEALARVEVALADATSSTIDLSFGAEAATLWFVDTHLFDLRRTWTHVPKRP